MHSHSMHHVSDFQKTQFVSQDFKGLRCRKKDHGKNGKILFYYISAMQLVFEAPCLLVNVELCATKMCGHVPALKYFNKTMQNLPSSSIPPAIWTTICSLC